jgi:hypothetical protein
MTPGALNEYSPTIGSVLADARKRQSSGTEKLTTVTFEVPDEHAPTLRSLVEEMTNQVGLAIENNIYVHEKELSLTRAAAILGAMRSAIYHQVSKEDPDFSGLL